MKSPVIVLANQAGQVIQLSKKNVEWGYIRVSQVKITFENGFANESTIVALISARLSTLKLMDYKKDQEIKGQILVIEQLEPFDKKNPEKDIKTTDNESGIECKVNGMPIYRKHFYTTDMSLKDIYLKHDNTEEIKRRKAEIKAQDQANLG